MSLFKLYIKSDKTDIDNNKNITNLQPYRKKLKEDGIIVHGNHGNHEDNGNHGNHGHHEDSIMIQLDPMDLPTMKTRYEWISIILPVSNSIDIKYPAGQNPTQRNNRNHQRHRPTRMIMNPDSIYQMKIKN